MEALRSRRQCDGLAGSTAVVGPCSRRPISIYSPTISMTWDLTAEDRDGNPLPGLSASCRRPSGSVGVRASSACSCADRTASRRTCGSRLLPRQLQRCRILRKGFFLTARHLSRTMVLHSLSVEREIPNRTSSCVFVSGDAESSSRLGTCGSEHSGRHLLIVRSDHSVSPAALRCST